MHNPHVDAARAEQFHRSGLEISELCRALELHVGSIDENALNVVADKYNAILQKYRINHDKADHDFYKAARRDQYALTKLEKTRIHTKRTLVAAIPLALLALIPAAMIALIFSDKH